MLHFLNRRYFSVLTLLVVIFSLLIVYMHLWGMDDTTEYYMFYEGEILSEFYQPTAAIAEFDVNHKEYFWGNKTLPKKYKDLLKDSPLSNNELGLYHVNGQDIYILPYWNKAKAERFYVIHLFDDRDQIFIVNQLKNIFTVVLVIFLVAILSFMIITNRQLTTQIQTFHRWLKKITDEQHVASTLPTQVKFIELVDTANIVQDSLKKQQLLQQTERELLQKEHYFLSSLSHELKTPLAIISAATSLMIKRNELTEKDQQALTKLAKATKKMQQLTQTLLQLWRQQPSSQKTDNFYLPVLVEQTITECQQRFNEQKINFNVVVMANESCVGLEDLAMIVIDNLIRNACQYSNTAEVAININKQKLFISNQYSSEQKLQDKMANQEQMYGFGLGLYLVDKICSQQSWLFKVNITADEFSAELDFGDYCYKQV